LPFLGQQLDDLAHLLLEPNLQDAVRLIDHEAGQVPEHKALGVLKVVQQPTRGGNLHRTAQHGRA
jgi:hypothetical protein